mmetsp:Transcript_9766/g.23419  ORF Transcript_9766/g.23419 Transcript_9766/m.23419 type:complete len:236 (+) Transcript_9766:595-1302(+)
MKSADAWQRSSASRATRLIMWCMGPSHPLPSTVHCWVPLWKRSRARSAWPWLTTFLSARSGQESSFLTPRVRPLQFPRRPQCSQCDEPCAASLDPRTSSGILRPFSAFSSPPLGQEKARTTSTSPSATRLDGAWAPAPSTSSCLTLGTTLQSWACTSSWDSTSTNLPARWRAPFRLWYRTPNLPQVVLMASLASTSSLTSQPSALLATRPRRTPRRDSQQITRWLSSSRASCRRR